MPTIEAVTFRKGSRLLHIETASPEKSGIVIDDIDGLNPPDADISVSDGFFGPVYNQSMINSRELTFSLELHPYPSIKEIRRRLYSVLTIGEETTVQFHIAGEELHEIRGHVKTCDSGYFERKTSLNSTLVCTSPNQWFFLPEKTSILSLSTPRFKFPFSNESLTEKLLSFGSVGRYAIEIDNNGDRKIGVVFSVIFKDPVTNLRIANLNNGQYFEIDDEVLEEIFGINGFLAGDNLIISTRTGNKYVSLMRSGLVYNILSAKTRASKWIELDPGKSTIGFTSSSNGSVTISCSYKRAKAGI